MFLPGNFFKATKIPKGTPPSTANNVDAHEHLMETSTIAIKLLSKETMILTASFIPFNRYSIVIQSTSFAGMACEEGLLFDFEFINHLLTFL